MCNACTCRIVIVLVMCVNDKYSTNTCTIILVIAVSILKRLQNAMSREEHTQNLGIRGREFGYQKLLICMSIS